jgi:hypothetical protein
MAHEGEKSKSLPLPNVTVPESGADPSKFGVPGIKGMAMNPIYAGVAPYPQLVADEKWVVAAKRALEEDGPDQFLVNLLYVLRRSLGCVEWGGKLPPDRN